MGEAAQQLVAAVVLDDRLGDHRAEPRHALAEPSRHATAMERQVGAAGSSRHDFRSPFEAETIYRT